MVKILIVDDEAPARIRLQQHLEKMTDVASITHRNLNDRTVEGLKLNNKNAFSVQYHPESAPGPHDSRYLFDDFVEMMASNK